MGVEHSYRKMRRGLEFTVFLPALDQHKTSEA